MNETVDDRKLRRGALAVLVVALAVGTAYRAAYPSVRGFWLDEISTFQNASRPLSEILDPEKSFVHPPLLYLLSKAALSLGEGEWALRVPSIAAGILGILLVFFVVRGVDGAWTGALAALLLSVNRLHVLHSREARHYAILLLFALAACLALEGALCERRRGRRLLLWGAVALCSALCMWTHLAALFFLASLGAVVLVEAIGRWREDPSARRRILLEIVLPFTIAMLVAALLFGWQFTRVVRTVQTKPRTGVIDPLRGVNCFLTMLRDFSSFHDGLPVALASIPFLAGAWWLLRKSPRRFVQGLLLLLLPPMAFALVGPVHEIVSRYFIYALPVYLWLVARGILWIGERFSRLSREPVLSRRLFVAAVTALAVAKVGGDAWNTRSVFDIGPEPWREVAALIAKEKGESDVVAALPLGDRERAFRDYYRIPGVERLLRLDQVDGRGVAARGGSVWIIGYEKDRRPDRFAGIAREMGTICETREPVGPVTVWRLSPSRKPCPPGPGTVDSKS
jgi:hypothetical protein